MVKRLKEYTQEEARDLVKGYTFEDIFDLYQLFEKGEPLPANTSEKMIDALRTIANEVQIFKQIKSVLEPMATKKDLTYSDKIKIIKEIESNKEDFLTYLNKGGEKIIDSTSQEEIFSFIKQAKIDNPYKYSGETLECLNKIIPKSYLGHYGEVMFGNDMISAGIIVGAVIGLVTSAISIAYMGGVFQDFSYSPDNFGVINFSVVVGALAGGCCSNYLAGRDLPILKYNILECLGENYDYQ